MEKQKIIMSDHILQAIDNAVKECEHDKLFVLMDEATERLCLPVVEDSEWISQAHPIVIKAGDTHKDLEAISHVWSEMGQHGGTRHSLLINLGGGMVTDLGGFAASTFKRGVNFINIPTTLLSMVDASVGGKTGINFNGLKNEIGVFNNAQCVILDTEFLKTMDRENLCSGYAEMIKHGLIYDPVMWSRLMDFDIWNPDLKQLQDMVKASVGVKEAFVLRDPLEKGMRKALNFGHTFGHAFESFAMRHKPILHGYAVAYGMVCELYLSARKAAFPTEQLHQTVRYIKDHYGKMDITCDDYPELLELMTHDKKNIAGIINFTLLSGFGQIRINQEATHGEILEALDFYREG